MHGTVSISDAVNWSSPLNRGLRSWWLALPGQQRGNVFRDLSQRNDGPLFGGPTWQGAKGRPGGWGAIDTPGTNGVGISIPHNASLDVAGSFSFSLWWYPRTLDSSYRLLFYKDPTGGGRNYGIGHSAGGSSNFWLQISGVTITSQITSTIAPTANAWNFTAVTYNAASRDRTLYTTNSSGVLGIGHTETGSAGTPTANTNPLVIADGTSFTASHNGLTDDLRIDATRCWSAADVHAVHQESRAGYPTTLNWHRPRRYAFQDEGGGGETSSLFKYLPLLGVG